MIPATLQVADTRSGRGQVKASNIGRALHKIPGRNAVSFVQVAEDGSRAVMSLDLDTDQIEQLVRGLPENEFNAWTPGGTLLSGAGSTLYRWQPGAADWEPVADLAEFGVTEISRLTVSPEGDRLAVVIGR